MRTAQEIAEALRQYLPEGDTREVQMLRDDYAGALWEDAIGAILGMVDRGEISIPADLEREADRINTAEAEAARRRHPVPQTT